jgi:hypothetical protein
MWDRERSPDTDQTDNNDGPEPEVLTCDNSTGRNPLGKEESQQECVIHIRGCKRC